MAFIIGIDLGTSNCAVAFTDPKGGAGAAIVDFPVPQLARPGEHVARALFPSVVYQPFDGEFPAGSTAMPWTDGARVTGEFARWQAARVPHRAITSAKSWLIHPGVDRQAAILPWGAPADVPRLSPVAAQAELLSHLARAWNQAQPQAPLAQQDVVLTIPASFDEAARALTLQAARDAGFDLARVTLLEEPQAAFYDFTSRHRASLEKALTGVRLVLVVDVGGGTTDFSLVQVAMLPEGAALQRLAVGDHLLLGGDNMDAALARKLETKLFSDGKTFTAAQWAQAVQQARAAKEAVLARGGATQQAVSIVAGGSKLVGGTLSTSLSRDEVLETVVQGFFPVVPAEALPAMAPRGGVVELGLPYAKDPAITRHLVAFLRAHADAGFKALGTEKHGLVPRPDAILLNGGVFNAPALADALGDAVSALFPAQPKVPLLPHDSLDLAVARGAAYSGLARRALGKKIGGGAPRAFYALVSDAAGGRQGVCLVPRGQEEGSTVELKDRTFQLTLGRPVQFQLFSTTADRLDAPGALVSLEDDVFKALPPIHTILSGAKGATIGVHLVSTLSEVGTLALSCVAGDQRWRLEFELKGASKSQGVSVTEAMPARFADATIEIERVFGTRPLPVKPQDVKQLFKTLERILGPREGWGVPVLRELWTALLAGASKRRRSDDHEKVMYQLLGYSLRPGVGYPLDAWRCEQTFGLFKELVTHHGEQAVWSEFWVLWRRISGGLTELAQQAIYAVLEPQLARRVPVGMPTPKEKLKGVQPQGLDEMVRCAASLELLSIAKKAELGAWVASRLSAPETTGGPWAWALGRLGARVPVHGAAHRVLSVETAEAWIHHLLALDPARHDTAAFALALLARRTGDRARDIDESVRARVLAHFAQLRAPASWQQLVAEVVQLSAADEARALGDTLPVGLSL
jgi:molecular chaperone DnaK (HSP70)